MELLLRSPFPVTPSLPHTPPTRCYAPRLASRDRRRTNPPLRRPGPHRTAAPTPRTRRHYRRPSAPRPATEFSHGHVLSLLLAARLCQPTALVNVSTWAA